MISYRKKWIALIKINSFPGSKIVASAASEGHLLMLLDATGINYDWIEES